MAPTKQPAILVVTYSVLANDGRVLRQIRFLRNIPDAKITVAAFGKRPNLPDEVCYTQLPRHITLFDKIKAAIQLKLGSLEDYDPSFGAAELVKKAITTNKFDLIICNDIDPLPAVFASMSKHEKVLLDAHEYYPQQFEDKWRFRFFFQKYMNYLCGLYLDKVDKMITVSDGLRDAYLKNYGVNADIVNNAPFYDDLKPSETEPTNIRLIYHGGVTRSRKIELMFDLVEALDERFTLDLMLLQSSSRYYRYLKNRAENDSRINLLAPVPPHKIASTLNKYDIGVYMMAPINFNHKHALPNKLFEFIQARLAVAIWPTPGMAKIVRETNCGILSDEFTVASLANALNAMTADDIGSYKKNSNLAASLYCAEKNEKIFCEIVNNLLD